MKDVIEESKRQPVLVDFWAEWCGPCKQLTPVLEKAVKAAKGKVKLAKMDIDKHPAIPGQMGIQSIPAVIAFVNGQPADGFLGALPESQVEGLHRAHHQGQARRRGAGSARRPPRRRSRPATPTDAVALYAEVLQRGPEQRAGARRARARPCGDRRDRSRPRRRSRWCRKPRRNDAAVAAARSALEVAEQAKSVGPVGELEQKVAANPLDHQARFDLAVALNAAGKRAGGGRPSARHRQARPQMERRRRAQAAGAVLRGMGPDRRGDGQRAAQAQFDPVRVDAARPSGGRDDECR